MAENLVRDYRMATMCYLKALERDQRYSLWAAYEAASEFDWLASWYRQEGRGDDQPLRYQEVKRLFNEMKLLQEELKNFSSSVAEGVEVFTIEERWWIAWGLQRKLCDDCPFVQIGGGCSKYKTYPPKEKGDRNTSCLKMQELY